MAHAVRGAPTIILATFWRVAVHGAGAPGFWFLTANTGKTKAEPVYGVTSTAYNVQWNPS